MKITKIIKGEVLKYRYNKELKLVPFNLKEEIKDFDELLLLQGDFIIELEDKNKEEVYYYSSISGKYDIFYSDNNIYFDFIESIENSEYLTVNAQAKEYFIKHRYYKNEETLFNEIKRVLVGEIVILDKKKNISLKNILRSISMIIPTKYEDFKRFFSESINLNIKNENIIFQSAGKDSNLIMSFSSKILKNLKLKALNLKVINPEFNINIMDTYKSERVSKKLNVNYSREIFDFSKSNLEELNTIILKMPLASHLCLNYKALFKRIDKNYKGNILCGQNADSLYNLGPTEQEVSSVLKRYYLSDFFISSLKDVEGKVKIIKKLISLVIKKIFEIKQKRKLFLPSNSREYIEYFEDFQNYLILNKREVKLNNENSVKYKVVEIRKEIFNLKLNSFFRGGDSRAVYYASNLDKKVKLIYSTNILVLFFMHYNYTMPIRDILIGKYYIRKYLKELFPEYFKIKVKKIKGKNYKIWCDEIRKSRLFIQIEENLKIDSKKYSIEEILGMYWVDFIIQKYKDKIINLESERYVK